MTEAQPSRLQRRGLAAALAMPVALLVATAVAAKGPREDEGKANRPDISIGIFSGITLDSFGVALDVMEWPPRP